MAAGKHLTSGATSDYQDYRDALREKERTDAWDYVRKACITAEERHASEIMKALREYERRKIFGNVASEDLPGEDTLDMGGQFLTNKARITTMSVVFKIAQDVPKGALLHGHYYNGEPIESLLQKAREAKDFYIWSKYPLRSEHDLERTEVVFRVLSCDAVDKGVDIFSRKYEGTGDNWKSRTMTPRVWMQWQKFCEKFEKRFKKNSPAEHWLKTKMVLSEEETYGINQTLNGVWAQFNQATRCLKSLLSYETARNSYVGEVIDRMIEDKVMYAELRPTFLPHQDYETIETIVIEVRESLKAKKNELGKRNEGNRFPFGLKLIYCTPRSIEKDEMSRQLSYCIKLKESHGDLICGFDLVGAEDRTNSIGFYMKELGDFKNECLRRDLDIPFMFHAGETLLDTGGSSDSMNSNLYDAVALGAKRIGHGFALSKHPYLIEKFKKTKDSPGICVELCPISNEILHLCRNIKEHRFPELLAAGIPCTLNTDNASLFETSMAHEFYQVMVGAPTISLHSWKQLAKWSLEYSCLSEDEKKLSQGILEESWKEFCKTVIQKYGGLMIKGDDETMILDEIKAGKMYAGLKPEQTSRESWNWASWMTAFMHRRRISRMSVKRGV